MSELQVAYSELAYALLVWTKRQDPGHTRQQVIDAEQRLRELSRKLNAAGYVVGK